MIKNTQKITIMFTDVRHMARPKIGIIILNLICIIAMSFTFGINDVQTFDTFFNKTATFQCDKIKFPDQLLPISLISFIVVSCAYIITITYILINSALITNLKITQYYVYTLILIVPFRVWLLMMYNAMPLHCKNMLKLERPAIWNVVQFHIISAWITIGVITFTLIIQFSVFLHNYNTRHSRRLISDSNPSLNDHLVQYV